jgi:hypothetical protein
MDKRPLPVGGDRPWPSITIPFQFSHQNPFLLSVFSLSEHMALPCLVHAKIKRLFWAKNILPISTQLELAKYKSKSRGEPDASPTLFFACHVRLIPSFFCRHSFNPFCFRSLGTAFILRRHIYDKAAFSRPCTVIHWQYNGDAEPSK